MSTKTLDYDAVFTENVKRILAEEGLTIQWLADESGLQRSELSRVLNNRQKTSIARAGKMADALGVQISDLFRDLQDH